MARLSHPNVVAVHDVGTHAGQLYIAMELIDGETLRDWRASATRTRAEIIATFMDAGRGLAAAHEQGLVHRDFKPDRQEPLHERHDGHRPAGRFCEHDSRRPITSEKLGVSRMETRQERRPPISIARSHVW